MDQLIQIKLKGRKGGIEIETFYGNNISDRF